ncbi:Uncharacterised protein [Mycobacteroides abscessus subsp. abscessus]|nr:Uncharacterised protein [Mycobacteroides abscessus subsp. abscessus]
MMPCRRLLEIPAQVLVDPVLLGDAGLGVLKQHLAYVR